MPLTRIVMHWTGGGSSANSEDRDHYHEIVQGDGTRILGNHRPEANNSTADGVYAAHTRAFNTGAIGLAVAGMAGADESPFKTGPSPINNAQLEVFAEAIAEYAETYGIEVNRQNVLTHAEVPITHNISQPGKWDITWLPGMKKPGDPLEVGDKLREMVKSAKNKNFNVAAINNYASTNSNVENLLTELIDLLKKDRA